MWLLTVEYRHNQSLLASNQQLLADATKRSLIHRFEQIFASLPKNYQELQSNWTNYHPSFYWFNHQEQVFPPQATNTESFWGKYWTNVTALLEQPNAKNSEQLSELMQNRIATIRTIESALNNGDNESLRQFIRIFLGHKENYQLSVKEEIVSNLLLLEIDKKNRWSADFVNSVLFEGFQSEQNKIKSVFQLLIENASLFNREDVRRLFEQIEQFAERINLPLDRLRSYRSAILESNFKLTENHCQSELTVGQEFISRQLNTQECILAPIDLMKELNLLHDRLVARGQLNSTDAIVWDLNLLPEDSSQLTLKIDRPSWKAQEQRQQLFMIIKVIILIILVALSIYAVKAIQQRQQRKEKYIQLKEDFVNLVSHELKTPLSSIRLMAETLQKRLSKNLDGKNYPQRIESEADRLWLMVDNILSFNRLQTEQLSISRAKVSLKQLIDDIKETLPYQVIINNNIDSEYVVNVDKPLFNLVLLNLISNAIKYNTNERVELTFESDIHHNEQRIIVTDNGIGIDPKLWQEIFESFFQANTKHKKGFGLGLALSRKVMQLHNGNISIIQSKSEGAPITEPQDNMKEQLPFNTGTQWQLVLH
ncbi:sensor histidine kinase [Pleionea sediminis]|uniref:sensor histidine kinase n=1 Tax=Pleionea sediminis TaxID=2569479 RepID=UPI0013DD9B70|nr:HAMP domain-containing sensor histidine kinase [Pleionea sediminis]